MPRTPPPGIADSHDKQTSIRTARAALARALAAAEKSRRAAITRIARKQSDLRAARAAAAAMSREARRARTAAEAAARTTAKARTALTDAEATLARLNAEIARLNAIRGTTRDPSAYRAAALARIARRKALDAADQPDAEPPLSPTLSALSDHLAAQENRTPPHKQPLHGPHPSPLTPLTQDRYPHSQKNSPASTGLPADHIARLSAIAAADRPDEKTLVRHLDDLDRRRNSVSPLNWRDAGDLAHLTAHLPAPVAVAFAARAYGPTVAAAVRVLRLPGSGADRRAIAAAVPNPVYDPAACVPPYGHLHTYRHARTVWQADTLTAAKVADPREQGTRYDLAMRAADEIHTAALRRLRLC